MTERIAIYGIRAQSYRSASGPSALRCGVVYRSAEFDGRVNDPHLETKIRNFRSPSLVEVIAKPISGILYGDELDVLVNSAEVSIDE